MGCPLIITTVTAIMHLLPEGITKDVVVPNLGVRQSDSSATIRCYLESGKSTFYYMGIIVIPLLCCNLILYLSVAWNLCFGTWAQKFGARSTQITSYITVVKMFFAMGIPWISEIITANLSWLDGPQAYKELILVFQIIIGLQGLILYCAIAVDFRTLWSNILDLRQADCGLFNRHRKYSISQPSGRKISQSTGSTPLSSLDPNPELKISKKKSNPSLNSI